MYRGSKKTVLVFKGKDSRIFDEAHFIVKENLLKADEDDIMKEANRIISEYGNYTQTRKSSSKKEKSSIFWYIWGIISGSLVFIIAGALLRLII